MPLDPDDSTSLKLADELALANRRAVASVGRLLGAVDGLRQEIAVQIDWRTNIRRSPWSWLLGAFFLGLLIGGGTSNRPSPTRTSRR